MGSSSGIQTPETGGIQTAAQRRIAELAKRAVSVDEGRTSFVMPFSYAGSLSASESPRFYPHIATRLVSVHVSLGTAGTSNTVVEVRQNGAALTKRGGGTTITLGSGAHTATADYYAALTSDLDYLTVAVTTAGSGAKDLTAQARFA